MLLQQEDRLRAWREIAGGQVRLISLSRQSRRLDRGPAKTLAIREVWAKSPYAGANLYQSDPDILTALIERFDQTAAGYEAGAVLPQVRCPVLLLQADPAGGGLMTNAEVEQALHLLAWPRHVQLEGIPHALHHIHPVPVAAAIKAFLQSC